MPEHDATLKAAGPTALTSTNAVSGTTALRSTTVLSLAAVATVSCAAGLATVLCRRARHGRRGRSASSASRAGSAGNARRGLSAGAGTGAGAGQQRTWIPARLGRWVKGGSPQPPHLPPAVAGRRGKRQPLPTIPRQRQTGPRAEAVTLSPAERAAFAGLVRRLADDGR